MLVLMGKRVSMCQGLNHFSGCLHHFVLAKLATSSIRVCLSMVQHTSRTASLGTVEYMTKIMPLFTENAPVYCLLYNCTSHIYINLKREIGLFGDQTNLPGPGTNISTSPLAPTSEFLKKGLSGKYILIFTWQMGKLIFWTLNTFFIVNGPNTQEYSSNSTKLKRKWFSNLQIHDKQYMPI